MRENGFTPHLSENASDVVKEGAEHIDIFA